MVMGCLTEICHCAFFASIPNVLILKSNSYILFYSRVSSFCVVESVLALVLDLEISLKEVTSRWGVRCGTCALVQ